MSRLWKAPSFQSLLDSILISEAAFTEGVEQIAFFRSLCHH
jgi:hypothetical protein